MKFGDLPGRDRRIGIGGSAVENGLAFSGDAVNDLAQLGGSVSVSSFVKGHLRPRHRSSHYHPYLHVDNQYLNRSLFSLEAMADVPSEPEVKLKPPKEQVGGFVKIFPDERYKPFLEEARKAWNDKIRYTRLNRVHRV